MARAGLQINIVGAFNPRAFAQAEAEVARLGAQVQAEGGRIAAGMARASAGFAAAGDKMVAAGKKITTRATLPIVAGLALLTREAMKDAESQALLGNAITANVGPSIKLRQEVEKSIAAWADQTGILDDQLRPAYANLIRATHDVGKANDEMAISIDIAAGKHLDIEVVTKAVSKAYNGSAGALGKLGIATKDASGKTLSFDAIMRRAAQTFRGAAATAAGTAAGQFRIMKERLNEAGESIGAILLPFVTSAAHWVGALANALTHLNPTIRSLAVGVLVAVAAAGPLLTIVGRLSQAISFLLTPTGLIIAAIALIAAGAVFAYKHLQPFHDAVDRLGRAFMTAIYYGRIAAAVLAAAFNGKDLSGTGYVLVDVANSIGHALRRIWDVGSVVGAWLRDTLAPAIGDLASSGRELVGSGLARAWEWITASALPALKDLASTIGGVVADAWPYLVDAAQTAASFLTTSVFPRIVAAGSTFIGWIVGTLWPALQRFGGVVAEVAKTVGPILLAIGEAIGRFVAHNPAPILAAVGAALAVIAAVQIGTAIAGALSAIGAAIGGIVAAAGTLLSPMVLIVAAVAAVAFGVVYAYKHFEGFRDALAAVGSFITSKVVPFFKMLAQTVVEQVGHLAKFWSERWDSIKAAVRNVLIVIGAIIYAAIRTIQAGWDLFGSHILAVIKIAWDTIVGVVKAAVRIVSGIIDVVLGVLSLNWSQAWDGIKNILGGVWDAITALLSGALSYVGELISTGLDVLSKLWSLGWHALLSLLSGVFGLMIDLVTGLPGLIWDGLGDLGSWLWGKLKSGFSSITSGVSGIVDDIVGFFTGLPGRITSTLKDIASAALGIGKSIASSIADGISGAVGKALDVGKQIANAAIGFINKQIIGRINNLNVKLPNPFPVGPDNFTISIPDSLKLPTIPTLEHGAIMRATPGGRLVRMAEAGHDEAAIPLGSNSGRRALSNALADAGAGQGITIERGAVAITINADRDTDVAKIERRVKAAVEEALAELVRTIQAQGQAV